MIRRVLEKWFVIWRALDIGAGLPSQRVERAATALLWIRIVEGAVAWLLFDAFFVARGLYVVLVPVSFVLYFVLNLALALHYRSGHASEGLVALDIAANTMTLVAPLMASGGAVSVLCFILPLKALEYFVVFRGLIALLFTLVVGYAVSYAAAVGEIEPFAVLASGALAAAFLLLVVGAPLVVAVLLDATAEPPPPPRGDQAPKRRGREAAQLAVANTLLVVSEAVSRLTRLDEILETVVEVAPRSLAVDYCGIALWAEDSGTYVGAVAAGAGPTIDRRFAGVQVGPDEAPDFEWVRRLGQCAVVPGSEIPGAKTTEVPDVLIAPLLSGQRFYGVIQFARRGAGQPFTQHDFTIADGIARQTAVALERARLVEEGHRLVRALESTGEAVLITDARERIIFVNPAFQQTFGYTKDEILGQDASVLGGENATWVGELGQGAQPVGWRGESVGYQKNGDELPVLVDISVIRSDDGAVQGGVAIIEDISAQKDLQEQMQRADRLAAVGEMAAGIAHEINNALTAIFGQTMRRDDLHGPDLRAALARVDGQGRRIAEIVQGLLNFARPRPPHPVPVDLVAVTRETLTLLQHDMASLGVSLETSYEPELSPALADPQQVQQVLMNLLGNALHAMESVSTVRRLRVEVFGIEGRVAVRVKDSGPGIPADMRSHIFDPFFSTRSEGSGLGLSVSYAIARAHGGELLVTSEPGPGAAFTFVLPVATGLRDGDLHRVLLVDDEPEVAEALADMLLNEGLEVERAATGRQALERLSSGSWDAVFLDLRLPDLSGQEVLAEIARTRPEVARRVVLVTGGLWRQESRLRQAFADRLFLAKPCTQEQVRAVLRALSGERVHAESP